jgi:hypothetical protein
VIFYNEHKCSLQKIIFKYLFDKNATFYDENIFAKKLIKKTKKGVLYWGGHIFEKKKVIFENLISKITFL